MEPKKIIIFIIAVIIALFAAHHRWGDSSHAMGIISVKGGKARHPAVMLAGRRHYTQIVTASVAPPYRGDARIMLEGLPAIHYEIHLQGPVVNFDLKRRPRLEKNTLYGLEPGDRIALWVMITPSKSLAGRYTLAFYDTATNNTLLKIPFIFQSKDAQDAGRTEH